MAGKLNAVRIRNLLKPGTKPGQYGDGAGLYLQVKPSGASWLFRYKVAGKGRLMGLGPERDVSLAEAREKARDARRLLLDGKDPLAEKRASTAAGAAAAGTSFRKVTERYLAAHAAGWRNPKHAAQWRATVATYAHPVLADLPVAAIDTGHVMRVLEPLWQRVPETASRVRGRIEAILDYATARSWRTGENPARWRGHLANLLPKRSKVARVQHHAALPWKEAGAFMAALGAEEGAAALALRFTILTAARTGEAIGTRWPEIDFDAAVWTIPGERMKAGRGHRVPLSEPALAILRDMLALRRKDDDPVFPGGRAGKPLSNMAMTMTLRRMQRGETTVHGFRSTFRDWCGEATGYPAEVAEAALAHVNKDKTEAAYARGDLFEKRRRLMAEWAAFLARPTIAAGDVVPLRRELSAG